MKKYVIGSLITSGVLMLLGTILVMIGTVTGGKQIIEDAALRGISSVLDKADNIFGNVFGWDFAVSDMSVSFNEAYPVIDSGSISDFEIAVGTEITDLEICMRNGNLEIQESDGDEIGIERDGLGKFQYYVEDGTLYVIATADLGDVTLYLPEGIDFEQYRLAVAAGDVDIKAPVRANDTTLYLGACDIVIEELESDNLNIESGACNLEISDGTVSDCSISYSASEIEYTGSITGNADLTGSAGNIDLTLLGDADQFNYQVISSWGSIDIPGVDMVGWLQKTIDNNAARDISINSSFGNVKIAFMIE